MLLCELRGINVTLFYGQPIMLINLINFKLYILYLYIFFIWLVIALWNMILKLLYCTVFSITALDSRGYGIDSSEAHSPEAIVVLSVQWGRLDIPSLTIPKIGHEKPKTLIFTKKNFDQCSKIIIV